MLAKFTYFETKYVLMYVERSVTIALIFPKINLSSYPEIYLLFKKVFKGVKRYKTFFWSVMILSQLTLPVIVVQYIFCGRGYSLYYMPTQGLTL